MVSTRGLKYKFTDGERVLCYEPDPTKAKVLYNSKVLQVIVGKDERGRKNVEYLIHFQGWNSSWDRCVSEDYVLKDTEENRKLQRELAEKSQLQLGAYLYRKERKKKARNLSEKIIESSEYGNNSSSKKSQREDEVDEQQDEEEEEEEEEDDDDDEEEDDDEDLITTSEDDESSMDTDDSLDERIPIDLSNHMKSLLEHDYELVNKHNKLANLPANPNVLEILEGYVRHCGSTQILRENESPPRRRSRSHHFSETEADPVKSFEELSARLNLCKEIVDGLRIYFDFTLGHLLLYNPERAQYDETRSGTKEYKKEMRIPEIKTEPYDRLSEDETSQNISQSSADVVDVKMEMEHFETDRKRSLRSHREPATTAEPSCSLNQPPAAPNNGISKLTIRNLGSLGHATAVTTNNHCSTMSTSSTSSYYSPQGIKIATSSACSIVNAKCNKLRDLANSWKIVPESYLNDRPQHPSTLYGAVHLARLFVKLPSLLYIANQPEKENQPKILPDKKLKTLIAHLQLFLSYLESKSEWFGEKHYMDNPIKCEAME